MPGLQSGNQPYHVTLTTADGFEVGLVAVAPTGKNGEALPHEFEGTLTPVDATEEFRPGGIPREFADFSAGAGYSYYDSRVPNGFAWAKNIITWIPHVAVPSGALTEVALPSGTHGEIRAGFERSGHLYFSTGRYACKVTNGTAASATAVADFATIASMSTSVTITSTTLYLGNAYWGGYAAGTAQPLVQHIVASDTFTSGATCAGWQVGSWFGVDGEGNWDQWMIRTVGTGAGYKITNSATPLNDVVWTPGTAGGDPVGDPGYPVNKVITSRQAPFMLKPEGIFIIQRNGVYRPNITPYWEDVVSVTNGANATILQGRLYANVLSDLDMIVGLDGQLNDQPFSVGPGSDLPNETPVAGDGSAICRYKDWVVYSQYDTTRQTSYVSFGKPREAVPGQPGITNFIWHSCPLVIEGEKVTWMKMAAPGGNPRMWVATRNAANTTSHLYWMSLPRNGNILQELASGGPWRARTDTCTLYLSSNPWSQGVHAQKAVRQVAVVSEGCSDASYLTPYVSTDKEARIQLGATVTESPYTEARIVDDINGRQVAPSIDFLAASGTTPPILRAYTLWAGEGIRASTVYEGRFLFGTGIKLRNGSIDTTSNPQATWEVLIAAQGPRPATIIDWKNTTYTIALEQGAVWKERETKDSEHWQIEAKIRFTVLAREPAYGDGSVYDSDVSYVA